MGQLIRVPAPDLGRDVDSEARYTAIHCSGCGSEVYITWNAGEVSVIAHYPEELPEWECRCGDTRQADKEDS